MKISVPVHVLAFKSMQILHQCQILRDPMDMLGENIQQLQLRNQFSLKFVTFPFKKLRSIRCDFIYSWVIHKEHNSSSSPKYTQLVTHIPTWQQPITTHCGTYINDLTLCFLSNLIRFTVNIQFLIMTLSRLSSLAS